VSQCSRELSSALPATGIYELIKNSPVILRSKSYDNFYLNPYYILPDIHSPFPSPLQLLPSLPSLSPPPQNLGIPHQRLNVQRPSQMLKAHHIMLHYMLRVSLRQSQRTGTRRSKSGWKKYGRKERSRRNVGRPREQKPSRYCQHLMHCSFNYILHPRNGNSRSYLILSNVPRRPLDQPQIDPLPPHQSSSPSQTLHPTDHRSSASH
jgi:hypothetical protein